MANDGDVDIYDSGIPDKILKASRTQIPCQVQDSCQEKLESYHESYTFATTVLQQTHSSLHRIWSDFLRLSMVKLRSSPAEKACALSIRLGGKVKKAATMCNIDRRTLQRLVRIDFTDHIK